MNDNNTLADDLRDRIRELETELAISKGREEGEQLVINQLEAALKEAELQRDSWKRIAESGLGIPQTGTFAEPGIGPIEPAPQDYTVQCICGWMGKVSTLKSLPGFKMGCPFCSQEFVPLSKLTFPANRGGVGK